jgi:hypothetical protein
VTITLKFYFLIIDSMITKADSIPSRSNKGRQGQDVIWAQFNDISFYIEDDFQENLYFQILKKLFPDIMISKIFPLGGKAAVVKKAKKSLTNTRRVFIVDKDFDDILNLKQPLKNIFYLERYSIENYIFEQNAIHELIREENPKIKLNQLRSSFKLTDFIDDCYSILSDLSAHFLLIMQFELGLSFIKIDPNRDCDLNNSPKNVRASSVGDFYMDVKAKLKIKNARVKYLTQLNKARRYFKKSQVLINIPGKYLANLLRIMLKKAFNFSQCSCDTFIYRLMKNCNLNSLDYLRTDINLYIS